MKVVVVEPPAIRRRGAMRRSRRHRGLSGPLATADHGPP